MRFHVRQSWRKTESARDPYNRRNLLILRVDGLFSDDLLQMLTGRCWGPLELMGSTAVVPLPWPFMERSHFHPLDSVRVRWVQVSALRSGLDDRAQGDRNAMRDVIELLQGHRTHLIHKCLGTIDGI